MLTIKQIKDWYIRKHHEILDNKFNIKPGYVFTKHPYHKDGVMVIGEMVRLSNKYKINVGFTNYDIPGHRMRKDSNGYWVQRVWYDSNAKKIGVSKGEFDPRLIENENWSNFGVHPWLVNKFWKFIPKWLKDKLAKYKWRKYNETKSN